VAIAAELARRTTRTHRHPPTILASTPDKCRRTGSQAHWKELFERLAFRVGKPKAIVAIVRKLLLMVWHVLTKHIADREAVVEKVAAKFLEWSWKLGRANRAGLDSGAFDNGERTLPGFW
jgi:hypothetical protein